MDRTIAHVDMDERGGGPESSLRSFASCSSESEKLLLMISPLLEHKPTKIKSRFLWIIIQIKMFCRKAWEVALENFKDIVIAWSKLAAIGARPIAESVGIDREFYARVLNSRRGLPDDDAVALGKAMGLTETGFEPFKIQSNLCRQLEDLQAVVELGFKLTYLAQILTKKEMMGGSSLQKYIAIHFSYHGVGRICFFRMASQKWDRLDREVCLIKLPVVTVDTALVSLLNNINESIEPDEFARFESLLDHSDEAEMKDWLQNKLDTLVANQDSRRVNFNTARRIQRNTFLSRIVEKHTSLTQWPDIAKKITKTHVLSPLITDFQPAMALGMTEKGERVFVYMRQLEKDELFILKPEVESKVDHLLIFSPHPKYDDVIELIYDGPVTSLIKQEESSGQKASTISQGNFSDIAICRINQTVDPSERLMRRSEEGLSASLPLLVEEMDGALEPNEMTDLRIDGLEMADHKIDNYGEAKVQPTLMTDLGERDF